ncbi:MAG: phosphatase PAP2 family protein [Bacteroidetes bacterium]|nr:phosphatase PAP2 family protein [Bacteroidota bacterium]
MADFFYSIDLTIFYFINHTIANPVFDKFFGFITDVKHWYLLYIVLLCIAFFKGGRIGKIAVIGSIFLIVFSDQFSSNLVKNLVERIRPCNALPDARTILGCTGSYSFPSSHSLNNFAIAVFFYRLFPKLKWTLLITAGLVAFSRPYLGLHYPSDIIFGGIIGAAIGYIFSLGAIKMNEFLDNRKSSLINNSEN